MYATKEKIRDLIAVINTLIPPPGEEPETFEVGSPLPVSGDLLDEGAITVAELQRSLKRIVTLSTEFTMGECSIIIRDTQGDDEKSEVSLLRTRFHGLFAHFELSNNDLILDMELSR